MKIFLPDALKPFVDELVNLSGYRTSSAYVRELIRKDRGRQNPRGLQLAGAESEPGAPVTNDYFDALPVKVRKRETR